MIMFLLIYITGLSQTVPSLPSGRQNYFDRHPHYNGNITISGHACTWFERSKLKTDTRQMEQSKFKMKINRMRKATVQTALHYTVVAAGGMEVQKY